MVKSPIDVGQLSAIRIRHDNSGVLPAWFLSKVEIVDTSAQDTNHKYLFECGKWLSLSQGSFKIEHVLKEAVLYIKCLF